MAIRKHFKDRDLLEYARCPLRQPHVVAYSRQPDEILAEEAVRGTLIGVFNRPDDEIGLVPSLKEIAKWVEDSWPNVEAAGVIRARFARFLNGPALTVTRHLHELLIRYSPCQPITPYTLSFSRASVGGEYTVVVDRRESDLSKLSILRIRPPGALPKQDVVNLIRWLHLQTFEGRTPPQIDTLNYCCENGEEWRERILDEKAVRPSITALIEYLVSCANVPVPGMHCGSCRTDACVGDGEAA